MKYLDNDYPSGIKKWYTIELSRLFFGVGTKTQENKTQNSMKIHQKLKKKVAKTQFSGKSRNWKNIFGGHFLFQFEKTIAFLFTTVFKQVIFHENFNLRHFLPKLNIFTPKLKNFNQKLNKNLLKTQFSGNSTTLSCRQNAEKKAWYRHYYIR